ncbi:MAG: hypothetical protein ACOC45_02475 [Alkalispirochaetaceae bacterium]
MTREYEIVVRGHLEENRQEEFEGMRMERLADGTTRLTGPVRDQAALHAMIKQVRDMGVELLRVEQTRQNRSTE